ncbi:hypothetical protein N9C70_02535 [Flavobacteriales bacterium]|nr:hypothetical protein [bacterium]MDA9863926.1 hypothetical protein [Flavobacteriales bacterium]
MIATRDGFHSFLQRKGKQFFSLPQLNSDIVQEHLSSFGTASTFNHERKRPSAILKPAYEDTGLPNPIPRIPKRKEKATLHKPFRDVVAVLGDIKAVTSDDIADGSAVSFEIKEGPKGLNAVNVEVL